MSRPLHASPTPARSALLSRVLLVGSLAFAAGACTDAPEDGDCKKLLERFIDNNVNTGKASDAEKAKQRAALKVELSDTFLDRCERNIKASQIACALKAETHKEIEACDS